MRVESLLYQAPRVHVLFSIVILIIFQNRMCSASLPDKMNVMPPSTTLSNSVMKSISHRHRSLTLRMARKSFQHHVYFSTKLSSKNDESSICFVQSINKFHQKQPTVRASSSLSSSPTSNWEKITNHQTSKTVKLFKSIHRANKSKRADAGLTIAEGVRLVTDILSHEDSRRLVRRIVVSETLFYGDSEYNRELEHWLRVTDEESRQRKAELLENNGGSDGPIPMCSINVGTDQVLEACSGTVSTQGVVALMDIPPPYDPLQSTNTAEETTVDGKDMPPFYLILDGLSDPGNVGTLLRTCAASHVTALILLPDSCDVWNPKAVRSAMGASFRVPVLEIGSPKDKRTEEEALDELLFLMEQCGVSNDRVYAATMEDSGDETNTLRKSMAHFNVDWVQQSDNKKGAGSALILGREGEGLRPPVRRALKQGKISTVYVPMAPGTESLNAAICGSVIMFERMRQWLVLNDQGSNAE